MVFSAYQWKRSAEIPLRVSVGNRISNNLDILTYNGTAPINCKYPYALLGEAGREEFCTKVDEGDSIRLTIHIYCKEPGYDQVNALTDLLLKAFRVPLQIDSNWQIIYVGLESGCITFRQGGDISHAVLYVRFKMWDTSY